jgi:undecaprenyl-phosphate 4-deoxy-4-formamido-L-arabinose transferase
MKPYISVVIPVYNEAGNLAVLCDRLLPVMDNLKKTYEIIFVNDGSKDNSLKILQNIFSQHLENIKIIDFNGNFGQHMAVLAGFQLSKGEIIITLDADLQNPPEEIPKLVAKIEEGFDLVSGVRADRHDSWFRRNASSLKRKIMRAVTKIQMSDDGCMLRAYSRNITDVIANSSEATIYIPALAYSYATNPTEITVKHEERKTGKSKYNLYSLIRLYFNLMTGHSLVPLQIFTVGGCLVSFLSILFVFFLILRRIFIGPEAQGVFTLFAIMFFLMGIILFGIGITGEYIGRIYQEVRKRPRFIIRKIFGVENEQQ